MKRSPLRRKTPLKTKRRLETRTVLKQKSPLRAVQKTARKRKEPYHSIFTDNMSRCFITGAAEGVEPHHIFGAGNKELSERYGFILPLRFDWHRTAEYSIHRDRRLSLKYRWKCQQYYTQTLGKSREEWINEFGHWWPQDECCADRDGKGKETGTVIECGRTGGAAP